MALENTQSASPPSELSPPSRQTGKLEMLLLSALASPPPPSLPFMTRAASFVLTQRQPQPPTTDRTYILGYKRR